MTSAAKTRRHGLWVATGAIAVVLGARANWCGGERLRAGTFNIEDYPKSERQEEGAFREIADLEVAALAVQEITAPERFAAAARARLGESWRFASADAPAGHHRVGVLYDGARLELLGSWTQRETQLREGGKPSLQARLRLRDADAVVRMIVVHLKAGADGVDMRGRQLHAIEPVVRAAVETGEDVVLLGDFNATGEADRRRIEQLARDTGLAWTSEPLACTSYWDREHECVGSPLDHVLVRGHATGIAARGPCETEGCETRDRCPAFHHDVSDHCPVTVDLSF